MALVKPAELSIGLARGQLIKGRVLMLTSGAHKTNEHAALHLVVEEGSSGTLYIEAWREQAKRLLQVATEGAILEFSNLTLKAMGDKAQWQCSDLDVYGHLLSGCKFVKVADDASIPKTMYTIPLRHLPHYAKVSHMVNVAGMLVASENSPSAKATAPAFNLVLADEGQSVRVAIWQNHASQVQPDSHVGHATVLSNLRVSYGKSDNTELGSSKKTAVLQPSEAMSALLKKRVLPADQLVSMSGTFGAQRDYSTADTTKIHLRALTSLIVPDKVREFAGEIYEVYHCLVADIVPTQDAEHIYYMVARRAKRKNASMARSPCPNSLATAIS